MTVSQAARILGALGNKRRGEIFDEDALSAIARKSARTMQERYGLDVFQRIRRGEKLSMTQEESRGDER